MSVRIALLRAVNVGGTGKIAMGELAALFRANGCCDVRTYIQSGNVVFRSPDPARVVVRRLEAALAATIGRPVKVLLRTERDLSRIDRSNPFPDAPPARVSVLFLDRAPSADGLAGLTSPGREEIRPAGREIFIHYPDGMGASKLRLPQMREGTARNLNTVRKLAAMAREAG